MQSLIDSIRAYLRSVSIGDMKLNGSRLGSVEFYRYKLDEWRLLLPKGEIELGKTSIANFQYNGMPLELVDPSYVNVNLIKLGDLTYMGVKLRDAKLRAMINQDIPLSDFTINKKTFVETYLTEYCYGPFNFIYFFTMRYMTDVQILRMSKNSKDAFSYEFRHTSDVRKKQTGDLRVKFETHIFIADECVLYLNFSEIHSVFCEYLTKASLAKAVVSDNIVAPLFKLMTILPTKESPQIASNNPDLIASTQSLVFARRLLDMFAMNAMIFYKAHDDTLNFRDALVFVVISLAQTFYGEFRRACTKSYNYEMDVDSDAYFNLLKLVQHLFCRARRFQKQFPRENKVRLSHGTIHDKYESRYNGSTTTYYKNNYGILDKKTVSHYSQVKVADASGYRATVSSKTFTMVQRSQRKSIDYGPEFYKNILSNFRYVSADGFFIIPEVYCTTNMSGVTVRGSKKEQDNYNFEINKTKCTQHNCYSMEAYFMYNPIRISADRINDFKVKIVGRFKPEKNSKIPGLELLSNSCLVNVLSNLEQNIAMINLFASSMEHNLLLAFKPTKNQPAPDWIKKAVTDGIKLFFEICFVNAKKMVREKAVFKELKSEFEKMYPESSLLSRSDLRDIEIDKILDLYCAN